MKRKMISVFLCLLLALSLVLPVSANSQLPRIVDQADLLTSDEEVALTELATSFRSDNNLDGVVLTLESLEGYSIATFADEFYEYYGYGVGSDYSGLVLVVAMEERELYISTCGDAISRFTDDELDFIINTISDDLSDGDYYDAFELFLELADLHSDYDSNSGSSVSRSEPKVNWFMSILIGAVAGGLTVFVMASSMNTKKKQSSAGQYLKSGSYKLHINRDIFLYSNVSKVRRQQNNSSRGGGSSSHRSSSGRSHGGRGGRF